MGAATGIEAEKTRAHARRAELLNELSQAGLIQDISLFGKLSSTSIVNAVGDLFSDADKSAKETLIRSAAAVAEARGEDIGLSFAARNRDWGMVGRFVKLGGIADKDVALAQAYLENVLEERKAQNETPSTHFHDIKPSTHFRDMVTSSRPNTKRDGPGVG